MSVKMHSFSWKNMDPNQKNEAIQNANYIQIEYWVGGFLMAKKNGTKTNWKLKMNI